MSHALLREISRATGWIMSMFSVEKDQRQKAIDSTPASEFAHAVVDGALCALLKVMSMDETDQDAQSDDRS